MQFMNKNPEFTNNKVTPKNSQLVLNYLILHYLAVSNF